MGGQNLLMRFTDKRLACAAVGPPSEGHLELWPNSWASVPQLHCCMALQMAEKHSAPFFSYAFVGLIEEAVDSMLISSVGVQVPQDGEPDSKYLARQQVAVAEINKRGLVLLHAVIQVTAYPPTATLCVTCG